MRRLEDVVEQLMEWSGKSLADCTISEAIELHLSPVFLNNNLIVIIDNLETLEDVEQLLRELVYKLSQGQSKFLLTTRHQLENVALVHSIPISELSFEDTYLLYQRRLQHLTLPRASVYKLYQIVGGLPLITCILAGLLSIKNLNDVLAMLTRKSEEVQVLDHEEETQATTL